MLGILLPQTPLCQLFLALGSRHIPCSPLLRVRQLFFAAIVGSDERDGEEGKGDEGGLFDGIVLWKEDNFLSSLPFLFGAAQHFLKVALREGAFLKAQRPGAVRLGVWEMGRM